MKKYLLLALATISAVTGSATTILAGSETSLQTILDTSVSGLSINVNGSGAGGQAASDSYWTSAGSTSAYMLVEIAGYAPNNVFGIYDKTSGTKQVIFNGSASGGATSINIAIPASWSSFGFYLENTVNGNFTWYSDASKNAGSRDHFVAFQGTTGATVNTLAFDGNASTNNYAAFDSNDYILAMEDLDLGDQDYNDMVVLVQNINPPTIDTRNPVPDGGTTIALAGLGLCGVALLRRKATAGK
jgi:VPDSG-CTERM motif